MADNKLMSFLRTAVQSLNQHASHHQFQDLMEIASQNIDIADIYTSSHAKELHTPVILLALSSHSICMAAYITALTGHPSATTPISRTALEAALYAYGISKDPELLEKWRNPPENRRNKINAAVCLRLLKANHPGRFDQAALLYEDCISAGAHPTLSSLFRTSNVRDHLHDDNHIYTSGAKFEVDVISEPSGRSITQLVFATSIHAYCLVIIALADSHHPRSLEIATKAEGVLSTLMGYLRSNSQQ
ncbi:hypothetical protein ACLPHM_04180 [Paenalcaligenes sp. Me131]|uniref:hypothetical protein n=1 Tax=Paenalcaligenes sp. Me131 TaxID=3392636 RepID=UPI003D2DDAB3